MEKIRNAPLPHDNRDREPFEIWLRRQGRYSRSTGRRWRKRGWIRAHRIAGRWYVSRAAAEEFARRANRGDFA